jgi:hypothetical protein
MRHYGISGFLWFPKRAKLSQAMKGDHALHLCLHLRRLRSPPGALRTCPGAAGAAVLQQPRLPDNAYGKGKVDVSRKGIVTFDVSDLKQNTQVQIGDCFVDYHNECKPDGKTKEAPGSPDTLVGSNQGSDKCANESKQPFMVHATITYTTNDGKKVTKSGSASANKGQPPVAGAPCNGYVPVGTCVTP